MSSASRCHHLLKTFHPEGAAMFPVLGAPTGTSILPAITTPAAEGRALKMPRREHTRDQARHARITAERAINQARLAD